MEQIFFDDWSNLVRTATVGILAYVGLIFLLRISGKRTLSKMNAFDFVVTVALGSTLATVLLNKDVSLAQGVLAFALLIFMQFVVTWASVRTRWVKQIVTGEPSLLFYQGQYLPEALHSARVTRNEVRAAMRASGRGSLKEVDAVVLETDGSFSVIADVAVSEGSSLEGVEAAGADTSRAS